jgi:hypothetical protein
MKQRFGPKLAKFYLHLKRWTGASLKSVNATSTSVTNTTFGDRARMNRYSNHLKRLYLIIHHSAHKPSFQSIFFPSSYVRP